jgi:DNA methylase
MGSTDLVSARVSKAVAMLAEAKDAQQAKKVVDLARAAEVFAKRQKLGDDAIREATAIKIDALTLMGEFIREAKEKAAKAGMGKHAGPGRGHKGKQNAKTEFCFSIPKEVGLKGSSDSQALVDLKKTAPEIHEKVRSGEIPVSAAVREVKRQKQRAKKAEERKRPVKPISIAAGSRYAIEVADCVDWLGRQPADSIDLVFGSPPYEKARLYLEGGSDPGIARDTEEWVEWMVKVYQVALKACKGLVAFVVEGQTTNYQWSAGPALLMANLHRAGICLRKPPVFHRVGIPGSGGPDWLRNDYEFIICATRGGQLPWSDNTAMGTEPKYEPGGDPSHRTQDGSRVNGSTGYATMEDRQNVGPHRARQRAGRVYVPPERANPGNVIHCVVGGGAMGNDLCHENEAPFPESLAEFFVRSFCPPEGTVADPFSGSGTTLAVAVRNGRMARGCDLRASQVKLTKRRLAGETPAMFA